MNSASRAANLISLLLLRRGGHGIAQRSMRALGVRWRASESGASMVSMEAPSAPYRDLHFPQHTKPAPLLRCAAWRYSISGAAVVVPTALPKVPTVNG